MRQIHAFSAGLLRTLGAQAQSEEEEDLDLLERELESRLGFPFDIVGDMGLSALVEFLSVEGVADADRMLLCGLLFARRSSDRANEEHRVRALALLARALEAKPQLLDERVVEVLRTLAADATAAMNTPADR